jgi:oxygen-independent coproporphyrinogen-3 oxidase
MTLGIYFHIPFCKSKCNYCGFYSITNQSLTDSFIDAILKEIDNKQKLLYELSQKHKKITIFFGGGTPTLLSVKDIKKLTDKLKNLMDKVIEFTIEANPESITEKKLKFYRSIGINRISIGVQSFDDKVLNFLGRPHRLKDAIKALEISKKYLNNISIDLIGGIPNFENTSEKSENYIKQFKPNHISFYTLSIDKRSKWFKNMKFDDIKQSKDYKIFCHILKKLNYIHYEISNFALKGYECKHNINYWERGEYLGFGPSAVSFLKESYKGKDSRIKNISDVYKYIENPLNSKRESISKDKALWEYVFLNLRTKKGLKKAILNSTFDKKKSKKILEKINYLLDKKIIRENKNYYYIPEKNFLITNEILLWILKDM